MKSNLCPESSRRYEFCFPDLDTLVQVRAASDAVQILATRDTFSERRKIAFVRELAAEGFISDRYEWFSGFSPWSQPEVRWVIDSSWVKNHAAVAARTTRLLVRALVFSIVLWLGFMGALLMS